MERWCFVLNNFGAKSTETNLLAWPGPKQQIVWYHSQNGGKSTINPPLQNQSVIWFNFSSQNKTATSWVEVPVFPAATSVWCDRLKVPVSISEISLSPVTRDTCTISMICLDEPETELSCVTSEWFDLLCHGNEHLCSNGLVSLFLQGDWDPGPPTLIPLLLCRKFCWLISGPWAGQQSYPLKMRKPAETKVHGSAGASNCTFCLWSASSFESQSCRGRRSPLNLFNSVLRFWAAMSRKLVKEDIVWRPVSSTSLRISGLWMVFFVEDKFLCDSSVHRQMTDQSSEVILHLDLFLCECWANISWYPCAVLANTVGTCKWIWHR